MGAGSSIEVPGGGTEGYHVLRVRKKCSKKSNIFVVEANELRVRVCFSMCVYEYLDK